MIEIVKKIATLILALGFISMSCAATIPPQTMPLGGTPRVETVGSTIGMSMEDLNRELGTPHGTDTCALPFDVDGEQVISRGRSFMWEHRFSNVPKEIDRGTIIMVCLMDGTVVSEHREWMRREGDLMQMGQTDTVDRGLLQEIMDNLLSTNPGRYQIEHRHRNKGFEI